MTAGTQSKALSGVYIYIALLAVYLYWYLYKVRRFLKVDTESLLEPRDLRGSVHQFYSDKGKLYKENI